MRSLPTSSDFYTPGQASLPSDTRKARFDKLNAFVRSRNGWIVSVPGAIEVVIEVLPGASLIEELRQLGYEPELIGEGERILPAAIVENFAGRADGQLELITAGSTRAVAETRRHAGIAKVLCYSLAL